MGRGEKLSEWEQNRGFWTRKTVCKTSDRTRVCRTCNGYGTVYFGWIDDEEDNSLYLDDSETCPDCDGTGERS